MNSVECRVPNSHDSIFYTSEVHSDLAFFEPAECPETQKHIGLADVCTESAKTHFQQIAQMILEQSEFVIDIDCSHKQEVLNIPSEDSGLSLLHLLITEETTSKLECFLEKFSGSVDYDRLTLDRATSAGVGALHLAAQGNYPDGVRLLVQHGATVDLEDVQGLTPLHHAALHKNTEAAAELVARGAALNSMLPSLVRPNLTTLALLLRKTPNVAAAIHSRLDASIKIILDERLNQKFILFDLTQWTLDHERARPLDLLHVFANEDTAEEGEMELIEHPVVQKMLQESWTMSANVMYYSILLFKMLFVITIGAYVIADEKPEWLAECLLSFAALDLARKFFAFLSCAFGPTAAHIRTTLISNYLAGFQNHFELVCIVGSFVLYFDREEQLLRMFGPLMFLAGWIDMMIIVGDHKIFGLYLDMYYSVLKQFLKILCAFSIFLVGFLICFWMYFKDDKQFSLVYLAVCKFFVMFIGELDYNSLIDKYMSIKNISDNEGPIDFSAPGAPYLIFPMISIMIFVVAVPVVLQSLLVGQVVNDISEINKRALALQLRRKAQQLKHLISSYDSIVNLFGILFPTILEKTNKNNQDNQNYFTVEYNLDNESLPEYVHNAYKIGKSNLKPKQD